MDAKTEDHLHKNNRHHRHRHMDPFLLRSFIVLVLLLGLSVLFLGRLMLIQQYQDRVSDGAFALLFQYRRSRPFPSNPEDNPPLMTRNDAQIIQERIFPKPVFLYVLQLQKWKIEDFAADQQLLKLCLDLTDRRQARYEEDSKTFDERFQKVLEQESLQEPAPASPQDTEAEPKPPAEQ